ncbi:MAG: hypothetical protein GF401_12805 [Chitinivibrionales bacterium]|nr:hypothetical protein [Chitinivibrionales bacterium]
MKGNHMLKRNVLLVAIAFLIVFLSGCAKQLTRDLQGAFPLDYMQDSEICSQKTPVKIALGKVSNEVELNDSTYARTKYFVPIPLLFVNFGVSGYSCKLGQAAFDSKIENFVREAFEKEALRSGCFEFVNDGSEEYTVDLTVVEQETKGPYTKYFYMYFAVYVYGYGYGQKAGPGQSLIALKMDLKDNNGESFSRQFESQTSTEMLRGKNDAKELRRNYVIGMVESVSFAFKDCIENSVFAINQHIGGTELNVGRKAPIEQSGDIEVIEE